MCVCSGHPCHTETRDCPRDRWPLLLLRPHAPLPRNPRSPYFSVTTNPLLWLLGLALWVLYLVPAELSVPNLPPKCPQQPVLTLGQGA